MKPAASFCQTGRAGGWILGCFKSFSRLIVEKSQSGGIQHEKKSQRCAEKVKLTVVTISIYRLPCQTTKIPDIQMLVLKDSELPKGLKI